MNQKIIFSNLSERQKGYIALFVELVILIFVTNVLLNRLIPFMELESVCKKMELGRIICFSMEESEKDSREMAELTDTVWIGQNLEGRYDKFGTVYVQPVNQMYFDFIKYDYYKKMDFDGSSTNKVVIVRSLASQYQLGETYSIEINDVDFDGNNSVISFTVVGILENDYVLLPPYGGSVGTMVEERKDAMFLIANPSVISEFGHTNTAMLIAADEERAQAAVDKLLCLSSVSEALCIQTMQQYNTSLKMEMMGTPIILFITTVVLCLTGFISNVMLSIILYERKYSIYYICGISWKKCSAIQMVTDFVPTLAALIVSLVLLLFMHMLQSSISFQMKSYFISLLLVLAVYIMSELIGMSQMRKKNVAEIVERMR